MKCGREFGEDNATPVRGGGTGVGDRDDHSKPHPATFSVLPAGSSKGSRAQDAIRRHRRRSEMRMTRERRKRAVAFAGEAAGFTAAVLEVKS
jgi:hypothetical protein